MSSNNFPFPDVQNPLDVPSEDPFEGRSFYQVEDPWSQKKYNIPDMSGETDILEMVKESHPKSKYPPEFKLQACALWAVLGSQLKVAAILNVNQHLISDWSREIWWPIALKQIRKLKDEELDASFTGMLESLSEELQKRIQGGDTIVDPKTGETRLQPVKARELATILGIVYDKRAIHRADPTSKAKHTEIAEHLENVSKRLETLVGKIPKPITVDGEFSEVSEEEGD